VKNFEYLAPSTLDEAVAILKDRSGDARPIAGGTDIVVQMKEAATRFPHPAALVDLSRISEIKAIEYDAKNGLRIGAGATMTDIAANDAIQRNYTALAEGAGVVGSLQTMNMATIGGNVCNAAPSAETAPALLAFEAQAIIVGPTGRRHVPIADFFKGPGRTALSPDEILAELQLPAPPPGTGSAYQRHTPRKQMDIAVVGVAAVLTIDNGAISDVRLALGAVAPTPLSAPAAEASTKGKTPSDETFAEAARIAVGECSPISDIRGSADFRRHLVRVMTERMLRTATSRASKKD
jgi:carbon-monoxide dehydrogenase medium subunit